MDILAAIHQRASVRSYVDRSVDSAILERLLDLACTADHPTKIRARIELVSGAERTRRILTYMVGSYGLVQSPPHLLVGVLPEESGLARVDLGYVLEQVVLEATRLRLGTCWVTGSYNAQRAGDAVGLAPGDVAAAVCALGYPAEGRWGRFHSRIVRRLAGGHRRKPLTEIIFSRRWGEPWAPETADPTLVGALEHARLAPSAHNSQPWRFIITPDRVALVLVRSALIDGGIVMAHLALASAALGWEGRWKVRLADDALAREWDLPQRVIPVAVLERP